LGTIDGVQPVQAYAKTPQTQTQHREFKHETGNRSGLNLQQTTQWLRRLAVFVCVSLRAATGLEFAVAAGLRARRWRCMVFGSGRWSPLASSHGARIHIRRISMACRASASSAAKDPRTPSYIMVRLSFENAS